MFVYVELSDLYDLFANTLINFAEYVILLLRNYINQQKRKIVKATYLKKNKKIKFKYLKIVSLSIFSICKIACLRWLPASWTWCNFHGQSWRMFVRYIICCWCLCTLNCMSCNKLFIIKIDLFTQEKVIQELLFSITL